LSGERHLQHVQHRFDAASELHALFAESGAQTAVIRLVYKSPRLSALGFFVVLPHPAHPDFGMNMGIFMETLAPVVLYFRPVAFVTGNQRTKFAIM
jgi:hypothetical protein